MSNLNASSPFFPVAWHSRVDDLKALSGIIYVIKYGLMWKDAPCEYGPYKTLYNHFVRWSKLGVFYTIFHELAKMSQKDGRVIIDSTHLKDHGTSAIFLKKGLFPAVSDGQEGD